MASENVLVLTDDNFEAEVLQSDLPVLVDFWADYCAPCKMIAPMVDELADEYAGKMRVGKLDTSENRQVAITYGVQSIPTLLFFKNGEVADTLVGANVTQDSLKQKLEALA